MIFKRRLAQLLANFFFLVVRRIHCNLPMNSYGKLTILADA
jgi:hypothetical protein